MLQSGRAEVRPVRHGQRVAWLLHGIEGEVVPMECGQRSGIAPCRCLDTHVCSVQTKRFNDEAANLPSNVIVMTISMDLPFAQKRFCDSEKVGRIMVLSDSVWRDFGTRYGLLIKDMGLLYGHVYRLPSWLCLARQRPD